MDISTNIQFLKGVGEKRAKLLGRLGISTVGDLLRYYPREYTDWSRTTSIAAAPFNEPCCIRATVDHKPVGAKVSKAMTIYKTVATDGESPYSSANIPQKALKQAKNICFTARSAAIFIAVKCLLRL